MGGEGEAVVSKEGVWFKGESSDGSGGGLRSERGLRQS